MSIVLTMQWLSASVLRRIALRGKRSKTENAVPDFDVETAF
jgi:hypothetical protein